MKTNRGELFLNNDSINKQIPLLRAKLIKQMPLETIVDKGVTSNSVCEIRLLSVSKHGENRVKIKVEMLGGQEAFREIDLDEDENIGKKYSL